MSCDYHPYSQGKRLYTSLCENCHAMDGSGLKKLIPPISNENDLKFSIDLIPCLIKNGISTNDSISLEGTYVMPAYPKLTPAEIANICNFLIYEFDYDKSYFSEKEIKSITQRCMD